jgi:hypothetical protein
MEARLREHNTGMPRSGAGRDEIGLLPAVGAKETLDGYGPKERESKEGRARGCPHANSA